MAAAPFLHAQFGPGAPSVGPASSIPQDQLLQPVDLVRMLHAKGTDKPLVLQVGSRLLFAEAHIAGSEYAGAGSQPAGLRALQDRVQALPRNTIIVVYCGCCPWSRCPNIAAAIGQLRSMGFTRAKALYIADNLGTDWVDKGFPVERGR